MSPLQLTILIFLIFSLNTTSEPIYVMIDQEVNVGNIMSLWYACKHPAGDIPVITIPNTRPGHMASSVRNLYDILEVLQRVDINVGINYGNKTDLIASYNGDDEDIDILFDAAQLLPRSPRNWTFHTLNAVEMIHLALHQQRSPVTFISLNGVSTVASYLQTYTG
eukprot:PhF_6_TR6095/c0_g1_i3/m.8949